MEALCARRPGGIGGGGVALDVQRLRQAIGQAIDNLPQVQGNAGEVHLSNELGRLFNVADKLAQQHKDQFISSELLLLAFLEDKGALGQLLKAELKD